MDTSVNKTKKEKRLHNASSLGDIQCRTTWEHFKQKKQKGMKESWYLI